MAEIGAAFLCAELGSTPEIREDHAAYIDSWLAVLKHDKRAIFSAAAARAFSGEIISELLLQRFVIGKMAGNIFKFLNVLLDNVFFRHKRSRWHASP